MGATAHRFVAALAGTPGATWSAATEQDVPGQASYGVALLSRYPAESWQTLRLPRIGFRFPMYLPGPRKVIMVREEPRAAVIGRFRTPTGPLVVVNTHLSYVPGWGRRQLRRIRRDLAAVEGRVVLMGDLNLSGSTPVTVTGYRSLSRHDTFPIDQPDRQLDHILARGDWASVIASRAVRLPLSDHLALVADVADAG